MLFVSVYYDAKYGSTYTQGYKHLILEDIEEPHDFDSFEELERKVKDELLMMIGADSASFEILNYKEMKKRT